MNHSWRVQDVCEQRFQFCESCGHLLKIIEGVKVSVRFVVCVCMYREGVCVSTYVNMCVNREERLVKKRKDKITFSLF